MIRTNLKCICGSNDFTIEEHIVPEGVSMVCETCGIVTPIAVKPYRSSEIYLINNKTMLDVYEKSFVDEVTKSDIKDALLNK